MRPKFYSVRAPPDEVVRGPIVITLLLLFEGKRSCSGNLGGGMRRCGVGRRAQTLVDLSDFTSGRQMRHNMLSA